MKNRVKPILLTIAVILVLNIIIFTGLTLYKEPYYNDAPKEIDSVYELYASDKYGMEIFSPNEICVEDIEEISKIEDALKNSSAIKLNFFESYYTMFALGKDEFVMYVVKDYDAHSERIIDKEVISNDIVIYIKCDIAYVYCVEAYETLPWEGQLKSVVYKVNGNELVETLKKYQNTDNTGFFLLNPNWRNMFYKDSYSMELSLFILSIIIEFVVSLIVINKFFVKKSSVDNNNTKTKKQLSDMQKR